MVVIELNYKKPFSEVEKHVVAHRAFLQKYYDEGILLASGPKIPRDGGVIIALAEKHTVEALMKNDPFLVEDVAEYRFIEFDPVKISPLLKSVINT